MKKLLYLIIPLLFSSCIDLPKFHEEDRATINQQRRTIDSLSLDIDNLEYKLKE